MTKITLELIENSFQRTNPLKDRELIMKGNKLSLIENLGTTLDQFDSIDFTDNEIHRFDNFPYLKRLKSINFTNNKVMKIGRDLNQFIPNLSTLIFINNNIQDLSEIDNLCGFKDLEFVSFLKNPVANQHNYRLYVIHRLPQVRILDFMRVKLAERQQAELIFGSIDQSSVSISNKPMIMKTLNNNGGLGGQIPKSRQTLMTTMPVHMEVESMENIGNSDAQMELDQMNEAVQRKPTIADMQALKAAIQNASSIEEVDKLNFLLSTGKFAGFSDGQQYQQGREFRN